MSETVYRQRDPQNTAYYQCIEDHFETFDQVYEDRFERQYGFFRSYVRQVIYRYLDCGVLKNVFARIRCQDCGHEFLLAFSCKRRHFCPSCHQKRVVEFGEWLCTEVVKSVVHRHAVFSVPKIIRRYFLYDRKLLSELSRCGWEALKAVYAAGVRDKTAIPGAAIPTYRTKANRWFATTVITATSHGENAKNPTRMMPYQVSFSQSPEVTDSQIVPHEF